MMQTEKIIHTRYPESRKHFFTNFVISLWFEKALKEVEAEGNPERIKRYEGLNPDEMVLEPPIIFDDKNKRFKSCIVDRQAGTLLVDKNIDQVNFETFIEKSNKSDNTNLNGDYSQEIIELVKVGVTFEDIIELINTPDKLSKDPIFHLTKEKGTDNYIIIYDNNVEDPTFDGLVSWIFNDYSFEHIKMEVLEEGENGYPNIEGSTLNDLYGGKITLTECLLIEKSITFNFIDLKQLVELTKK